MSNVKSGSFAKITLEKSLIFDVAENKEVLVRIYILNVL